MENMTSRERLKKSLNHEEPDKITIDFGGMRSSGISAIAYNKLKNYLNITKGKTKVYDVFQQLAEPEEEILNRLDADVVQLQRLKPSFGIEIDEWRKSELPDGSECIVPKGFKPTKNDNGDFEIYQGDLLVAKRPKSGLYFHHVYHPYADVNTKDEIDKIDLPEITDKEIEFLRSNAKKLHNNTDYGILGAYDSIVFESGQIDWGYERYYIELGTKSELIKYYHNKRTENHLKNLRRYLDTVGEYIDVINFSDDLGTQKNPQISREMYQEMIKPYHKQVFQYVRKNYPSVKVFFHSCGAIYDLIPDLIEAGVQILNPVQLSADKMDPRKLKNEFGNDLVFWGGGVDTQSTLTFGDIEEIKDEVKRNIEIFAPGGGFVFTQVHNIQANISPERVMTIYISANKLRKKY